MPLKKAALKSFYLFYLTHNFFCKVILSFLKPLTESIFRKSSYGNLFFLRWMLFFL